MLTMEGWEVTQDICGTRKDSSEALWGRRTLEQDQEGP